MKTDVLSFWGALNSSESSNMLVGIPVQTREQVADVCPRACIRVTRLSDLITLMIVVTSYQLPTSQASLVHAGRLSHKKHNGVARFTQAVMSDIVQTCRLPTAGVVKLASLSLPVRRRVCRTRTSSPQRSQTFTTRSPFANPLIIGRHTENRALRGMQSTLPVRGLQG